MVNKDILNDKLDLILKNQEKMLAKEEKILSEEMKIEELEKEEILKEDLNHKTEEEALFELEKLENQLKKNNFNPLKTISKRDFFKGFIGAFVGIMGHFAFSKASDLAIYIGFYRATLLYFVAMIMIVIMLYYTGFRNVEKHIVLKFMPLRAIILYSVSIFTILFVNLLFGKIAFPFNFMEIYILVSASIILAVMGAGMADLIGKNE